MSYRCPLRDFSAKTRSALAAHMVGTKKESDEHVEWIESHGISYLSLLGLKNGKLGKRSYAPLIAVIEK
jgi:hypothetical protein